jgi:hypothetical protein
MAEFVPGYEASFWLGVGAPKATPAEIVEKLNKEVNAALDDLKMDVAKRRGSKRAKVALARKIGIILHRMWIDGTSYRWAEAKPIAAQA